MWVGLEVELRYNDVIHNTSAPPASAPIMSLVYMIALAIKDETECHLSEQSTVLCLTWLRK